MKITYIYEDEKSQDRQHDKPFLTIVSEVKDPVGLEIHKSVTYGFSFYNENDDYNKQIGIDNATQILTSGKFGFLTQEEAGHDEIVLGILTDMFQEKQYPNSKRDVLKKSMVRYFSRVLAKV